MIKKKIIIDCDTGVDDCFALSIALTQNNLCEVVAITCVNGNVDLDKTCMNTMRTVAAMDAINKVPVFRGCLDPLVVLPSRKNSAFYHGSDGLGDEPDVDPRPSQELIEKMQKEHASNAICRLSKLHCNDLELICLGPLTNIAVALRLDPELPKRINKLHVLGGTSRGVGNVTVASEFNFYTDPEAIHAVLFGFSPHCPIELTPYETTIDCGIEWEWFDEWFSNGNEKRREFLRRISHYSYTYSKNEMSINFDKGHHICDAYTVCTALIPSSIRSTTDVSVGVELGGMLTRGSFIIKKGNADDPHLVGKVKIIHEVDVDVLKSMFVDIFSKE